MFYRSLCIISLVIAYVSKEIIMGYTACDLTTIGFKLTPSTFTLPEDTYSAISSLGINKSSAASLKQHTRQCTTVDKNRRKSQQLGRRPISEDPFITCDYSMSTIPVRDSRRPDIEQNYQICEHFHAQDAFCLQTSNNKRPVSMQ